MLQRKIKQNMGQENKEGAKLDKGVLESLSER
jgi:hypothetical protein